MAYTSGIPQRGHNCKHLAKKCVLISKVSIDRFPTYVHTYVCVPCHRCMCGLWSSVIFSELGASNASRQVYIERLAYSSTNVHVETRYLRREKRGAYSYSST